MAEIEYLKDRHIRIIKINRPESLNALTYDGEALLGKFLEEFQSDNDARVAILNGTEKAFSTGIDLKSRGLSSAPSVRPRTLTSPEPLRITKPIIASISGYALGGGLELALACDIRIAADNARLGLPEVRRGLMPGAGGIQRLARLIPLGDALNLLFTGEWIPAEEAYRVGLVQKVVPFSELEAATLDLAEKIAANAPLAVQATKEGILHGLGINLQVAIEFDRLLVERNRQTNDSKEGVQAFLERRPPNFQGN